MRDLRAGPFPHARSTAALAGIALALGSPTAALIPAGGAVVWNRFIRPTEEAFLQARFGEPFRRYQRQVRCWVPTWPPYEAAPTRAEPPTAPTAAGGIG